MSDGFGRTGEAKRLLEASLSPRLRRLQGAAARTCERLLAQPARPRRAAPAGDRPRIALVVDTEGWAFSNIARQLLKHLSHRYDFRIVPLDAVQNVCRVLMMTEDCDLVHFFWREALRLVDTNDYRAYGDALMLRPRRFARRFLWGRVFTTAVYDHLFLEPAAAAERIPLFARRASAYYVSSRKLEAIYRRLPGYPAPDAVLEDGVDLQLFRPRNLDRFQDVGRREVVVGWSGNSQWEARREDFKGVHTILTPAIEQLRREGLPLRTHFADRAVRQIPHAQMPAYYAEIDVYVCASKIEGTPNPVLESMACGVPVVSTDVGIVSDALGPKQQRFILQERSVECLKDALRRLVRQPSLFAELSEENLRSVRAWDWALKARPFARFFDTALSRGAGALRRAP